MAENFLDSSIEDLQKAPQLPASLQKGSKYYTEIEDDMLREIGISVGKQNPLTRLFSSLMNRRGPK